MLAAIALAIGLLFQTQTSPWITFLQTETVGVPTFTLPTASLAGSKPVAVKVPPGFAATTVGTGDRGMQIDGASTFVVAVGAGVLFQVIDNQWRVIATFTVGGGSGAPTDGEYVTYAANASLTQERVLVAGINTTINTGTPGQIAVDAAPKVVDVNVNFGAGNTTNTTIVTGETWVTAVSAIDCNPTAFATPNRDEGAEDAAIEGLISTVHSRVAGTGWTILTALAHGLTTGRYIIQCMGVP